MKNPETVIRRYLDDHGGRVEAHIRHVTDSWDIKDAGEEDLQAIRDNLAEVGVATDPPLPSLTSDGRLTLYVTEGEAEAAAEPDRGGVGTAVLEAEPEEEASEAVEDVEDAERQEADAPHEGRFPKRLRRFARSSTRDKEQEPEQAVPAASSNGHDAAARELPPLPEVPVSEAPPPSDQEVAKVVEMVLGEQAESGLRGHLERLGEDHQALQDRLDAISQALGEARRAADSDEPGEGGARDLAQLQQRLENLSLERPAQLEALYRNLVQSEEALEEAQNQRDAEADELRAELAEARESVAAARTAVNDAIANPDLRAELDGRVAELSHRESAETDLLRRFESEDGRWAARLHGLHVGVGEARDTLGRALVTSETTEDGRQPPDPALAEASEAISLAQAGSADLEQRLSGLLTVVERERAQAESIRIGLRDAVAELRQGVMDAALGTERRSAVQDEIEAFMQGHRRELERTQLQADEWLRSVRDTLDGTRAELEQERQARTHAEQRESETRAQAEQRETDMRAEAEQRESEMRAQAEQRESELGGRVAELESTLAEHEKRERELTEARGQLDKELAATRQKLERTSAELDSEREARTQSEQRERDLTEAKTQVDKDLTGIRKRLEDTAAALGKERDAHAQSTQRVQELEAKQAEAGKENEQQKKSLEEVQQQLSGTSRQKEELSGQLDSTRSELKAARSELEERQQQLRATAEQADAEAKQKRELQSQLDALKADLEAIRAEREQSVTGLNEAMKPVQQAEARLEEAESGLAKARAEEERLVGELERVEHKLEERRQAVSEAQQRQGEHRDRKAELEHGLSELEESRGTHAEAAEEARGELSTVQRELESALADAGRRAEEVEGRRRTVTEAQRNAASALFAEGPEAARLEQHLHDAIEREQESLRALDSHNTRAEDLRERAAAVERRITTSQKAEAEAHDKVKARRTELGKIDDERSALAQARKQAEQSVIDLGAKLDEHKAGLEQAKAKCAEQEELAEARRSELQQAREALEQAVSRQAAG